MGTPVTTTSGTAELTAIADGMRSWVLRANKHPGGASSMVEAITALYFSGATTLANPNDRGDRLIYSKGHAAAPWYFALWALGAWPGTTWQDLAGFGQLGHSLPRMPRRGAAPQIPMSTGALGQGLSFGAGTALADRRLQTNRRTFVVLGDGECTEGQVWEAAMTAPRLGLRNLVAVLDANGSGSVIELPCDDWAARWRGFGWSTREVDGHDIKAITSALHDIRHATGPTALILRTVKGKGLLAPAEGSNSLSAEAAAEHIPNWDTVALIDAAVAAVDIRYPAAASRRGAEAVPAGTAPPEPRLQLPQSPSGHPVGAAPVAKKTLAADLAAALACLPMLWMAPDAIRNCGLLDRMTATGSWHWDIPESDVLQCAIAEQDAASLAAGAAAAGLWPVLVSMEGFYWRMLDQIRQSIAFPQLPVLLIGTSGGLGDPLGPMVQSDGCLTALTAVPGLDILEAGDINTATVLALEALSSGRPCYLRLPHEAVPVRDTVADLAARSTGDGVWQLRPAAEPDVVIATAGALREAALDAAELLHTADGTRVRVLEIISPTRAARLTTARRAELFPSTARHASIHNAPASVLGSLLPDGALAIGADGYGLAGFPQSALYAAVGLTAQAVAERIRAGASA
ncbi:thiamine pyrophosphate-dependent enzyme [Amycolatopsis eburnea]|nr:thiamine pyrophosphate-dependent enzyme [Amycolatopsis eburnea]